MPCESCAVQFSVFRRKRACSECERLYCGACLRRGGGMCAPCRALSTRPLARHTIAHLKVRDLQCFLQRQNVSTRGCVEKEDLVNLCVLHVNSASYRRRGQWGGAGPFSSLKGFTNNLNDLINQAFDLRNSAQPAPAPPSRGPCYNAGHMHTGPPQPPPPDPPPPQRPRAERFTTNPGGEPAIVVGSPPRAASPGAAPPAPPVDTADCFEIEDLDDAGWEFVARPADPLPNDSEVLLAAAELRGQQSPPAPPPAAPTPAPAPPAPPPAAPVTPARASSVLDLRPSSPSPDNADAASLQDEPTHHHDEELVDAAGGEVQLERVRSWSQLAGLPARSLLRLLARHRVAAAGCVERADLLQRARTLWDDHVRARAELDQLPLEDCCKICMAAPLECVLLECGHIAACVDCARVLAECPICRRYVQRAVRCFKS